MFQLSPRAKKIVNALIVVVIAVAALWGYTVTVVQPQIAESQAQGRGLFFPTELKDVRITGDVIVEDSLTVDGAATLSGAVTQGGAQTAGGVLNMSNYAINNIGNAGTDFDTSGGLSLAGNITASGQISTTKLLLGANSTINEITFGSGNGASAADGGTIAHTMSTTPTICILSQLGDNTITRTVVVASLSSTNITIAASVGVTATVTFACYR